MLSISRSRPSHLRLVHSTDAVLTNAIGATETDRQRFRLIEGGGHSLRPRARVTYEQAPLGGLEFGDLFQPL